MKKLEFLKVSNLFLNISTGLLGWIFIIIPLILPLFISLNLLRRCVHILARIYRPDLIPIENVADATMTFIPSEKSPSLNVAQIWRVKGQLGIDKFRKHFYKCFLSTHELRETYSNFYCYFEQWGFYCFKKPVENLQVENHIREFELENGLTLEEFVGKWMTEGTYGKVHSGIENNNRGFKSKIDKVEGTPSWEILLINRNCGEKNDEMDGNETVLLFKIHPGLCDGYTFVHLVEKLTGVKSPYVFKENGLSFFQKIKIWLNLPNLWYEYHLKQTKSKDLLYPPKEKTPRWFISFSTLDLNLIKKIRRKTQTHFNSVFISAFVQALRRHFLESGIVSEISKLPEIAWVGSSTGWPDHPAMTGNGAMTNHMTISGFRVPLREQNPKERLIELENDFNLYYERGVNKLVYWALFKTLWAHPAPLNRFANKYDNFGFLRYTTYVSPLMLSNEGYELLGHSVESLYLPVVTPSLAPYTSIYVVPVSISGKVDLSINASSEVFNDQGEVDRFARVYFKEALNELVNS